MTRRAAPNGVARLLVCVLAGSWAACDSNEPSPERPSAPLAPAAVRPPRGTAKVFGRITFDGAPPEPRFAHMSADPYCVKTNEGADRRPPVRVGANGGLADVFVYVSKGIDARYTPPPDAATLDQRACDYVPKVLGLEVGQPLEIRNSDETLHNVHALSEKGDGFNIGMPQKGMSAVRKFTAPEVLVRLKCDVHPWMTAYVGVVDHPFHAVTDEDGSYELAGLPAGEYAISAVHYELGGHVEEVTLGDGAAVGADFLFSD